MRTEVIYKCCRCGKEYHHDPKKFSFGKFRWIPVSQTEYGYGATYSKECELCKECFDELKHWLSGTEDEVKHLKHLIETNDETIAALNEAKNNLIERNKKLEKEKKLVEEEFRSCKSFCPRESSDWKEYCKWVQEKVREEKGLTDKGVIY